ncbi:MAG: sulfite exporter TauE/SafE family protein [Sandaracinobacteroides sp.]
MPILLPALLAGAAIGLILGLIGAGGSILAVPLLVYVVGVPDVHAAIGTAAVAVSINALLSLAGHARAGTVKWGCALVFAAAGSLGALAGARAGKATDPDILLALFGLLMLGVGLSMLRKRRTVPDPGVRLSRESAPRLLPRLIPLGLGTGLLAGFFGIGGGFLIVPALMLATAMPIANAVGTSLVVVFALGATTAASYALAGHVDWALTGLLVAGGAAGALIGILAGKRMTGGKDLLTRLFALIVIATGLFVGWSGLPAARAALAALA